MGCGRSPLASGVVRWRLVWLLLGGVVLVGAGAAVVVASTGPAGSHNDNRARTLAVAKRHLADRVQAQQRWYEARRAQLIRQIHQARAARRATPENAGSSAGGPATISTAGRPKIVRRFIPFGAKRHAEMRAYVQRHYGLSSDRLTHPHVIVEHYTDSADAQSAINTFTADAPDVELHELPGVCSHFVIDTDGTIYRSPR
jgi:hypothetical protein